MAKEIKFDIEARDLLKAGVDKLSNAVKVTLVLKAVTLLSKRNLVHRKLVKMVLQ